MDFWQIALGVGGGLIALFGFSFGIFWNIIEGCKKDLLATVKAVDGRVDEIVKDRMTNSSEYNITIKEIRHDIQDRPTFEHVDRNFVRKDTLNLELKNIDLKIDTLTHKIDTLVVLIKNGHK